MTDYAGSQRPGPVGYVLAVLLLLAAIGWFAGSLVTGLNSIDDRFHQVVVPGEATIKITEPGRQTIYHEYRSNVDGKTYSNPRSIDGLELEIESPGGGEVDIDASTLNETYELGSRAGVAIAKFDARRAGRYTVRTETDDKGDFVLTVGRLGIFALIAKVLLPTLLLVVAALATFVVTLWRRHRHQPSVVRGPLHYERRRALSSACTRVRSRLQLTCKLR